MLYKNELIPNKFVRDVTAIKEIKQSVKEDKPPVNTIEKKKKAVSKPIVIVYK